MTAQHGHGEHVRDARGGTQGYAQGEGEWQGHVGQVIVEQYPSEQVGTLGRVGHHVEHDLYVGCEPGEMGDRGPVLSPAAGQPAPQQRGHVGDQQDPRPRGPGIVHGQAVHVEQHGRGHVTRERRALLFRVVALVQALGGPVREPSGVRRRGRRRGRGRRCRSGFHRELNYCRRSVVYIILLWRLRKRTDNTVW